jgi:uncharacterized membrane protein
MVMRVLVRSRNGNFILAVVGGIYALSAAAVLGWFVVDVWRSGATIDLLLQVALVAAVACGVWFLSVARQNLRLRADHRRQ